MATNAVLGGATWRAECMLAKGKALHEIWNIISAQYPEFDADIILRHAQDNLAKHGKKNGHEKSNGKQTSFVKNLPRGSGVDGMTKYELPGVWVYIENKDDQTLKIEELEKKIVELQSQIEKYKRVINDLKDLQ